MNKPGLQQLESTKSSAFLNLRLEWQNIGLNATVHQGPFYKRTTTQKQILNGVSGVAEPGELLAIMGPSGGGKTSLLNSLSRRTKISQGKITLNSKKIPRNFNKLSAYVMQDDRLFEVLTPRELFQFSANLRLPRGTSEAKKKEMVEDVIVKLKMSACADTRVGGHLMKGLSGGERKRTAIGYELITNPGLLFLDEPTTGLDSSTAFHLLQTLKELAREGHTVICTIHQPSSEIFSLFDKLNLLVKGEVAYFGSAKESIEFFGSLGHPCPTYTNPADFFMTVLQTHTEEDRARTKKFVDASKERFGTLLALKEAADQQAPEEEELEPLAPPQRPPFWVQVLELMKRNWTVIIRNPLTFRARVGQTVIMALLVGCVYYQLPFTYGSSSDRLGGLFYITVSQIMSSLNSVLLTFPLERSLLIREQTNGMYGVTAYFVGKTVSALPLDIFFPTLFGLITYWMVNLNTLVAARFFLHWFGITMLSLSSASLGLLLGCMLPNAEVAVTIAPIVIMPFMLFGGFYMKIEMIPAWLRWLQYLSLFKWGFQALVVNEFHDTPYTCTDSDLIPVLSPSNQTILVCPMTDGNQILENNNFSYDTDYWNAMGIIIGLAVGFRILALGFLQYQTVKGVKKDQ